MFAKTKSATIFKIVLAFALILPTAFMFAACSTGDPIEQAEGLEALANAVNTETYQDVESFTITQNYEVEETEDGATSYMKMTNKNTVYKTEDATVVEISASVNMDIHMAGFMDGTSKTSSSVTFKMGKVGENYYMVNEGEKLYVESTSLALEGFSSFLSNLTGIEVIDADFITNAGEGNVEADLRTTGENSYNLKFVVTEEDTVSADSDTPVKKTVTTYYYEIRDGKITKYEVNTIMYEDDVQIGYEKTSYTFEYSAKKLSMPTSIEGYEETTFDINDLPII